MRRTVDNVDISDLIDILPTAKAGGFRCSRISLSAS